MNKRFLVWIALMTMALAGVTAALGQATDTATYSVRFQATWSPSSHPVSFPPNPHFSGLIGGVHNADAVIWRQGGIASTGIERMAEVGAQSPLDNEVEALISAGQARQVIRGGGLANSPGGVSTSFTASLDHPLVSLVSMLAPSPDWFVGVSGLSLLEGGDWVEQKVVSLYTWDAGTDSGTNYTSSDFNTSPKQPITRLTTGPFTNNDTPVGRFTFTRVDSPEPPALILNDGRFRITAEWMDFDLTRARARPMALTEDTGYFWFFNEENVEVVVKVLDGCAINNRFWVFAGGLTNVEIELKVEEIATGQVNIYPNILGDAFQPVQDSTAFATCP
ncbi:MAG: spondin domain-containing protein [Acidobacteriota bacterium]